jgi:DNA repair protein RecO (recombination protein O)
LATSNAGPAGDRNRRDAQPGFVLHTYPFRETSLVVEAFTRNFGRVGLVARGARRPKSSLRGLMMAFQPLLLSWAGKSELRTLHKAEWQGGVPQLHGLGLMCGFYLNELLLKFLAREDPHEALYGVYQDAIMRLAHEPEPAAILRRFEKVLLKELGYEILLDREADTGRPIDPNKHYTYIVERGPVAIVPEANTQLVIAGQTLIDLQNDDFASAITLAQSKSLMRFLVNHYLGNQELLTRQLLREMQQI